MSALLPPDETNFSCLTQNDDPEIQFSFSRGEKSNFASSFEIFGKVLRLLLDHLVRARNALPTTSLGTNVRFAAAGTELSGFGM